MLSARSMICKMFLETKSQSEVYNAHTNPLPPPPATLVECSAFWLPRRDPSNVVYTACCIYVAEI